jgi:tetratricopeptide (TPR) repeat protein
MRKRAAVAAFYVLVAFVAPLRSQPGVNDLNDAGWKALKRGDADRAAVLFAEALTRLPNDPVLLLGAGAAAHARGQQRDAIARLKRALDIDPRLTPASHLLGAIAFQEGDVDLAIRTYEQALRHAPGDAVLSKALNDLRREADVHSGFEERRYDRFRVMFEGRADESLAAQATDVLTSAFWRIGSTLGEYPSNTVITILYTEKQFRDVTDAPEWSSGQFDGRIRIPAAGAGLKPERFERVLTHELAHAMVSSIAPRGVPAWLNEGLAQYFEGQDPLDAERRLRGTRKRIPLQSLDRNFRRFDAADARVAYDQALLAVAVMAERPGFGWARLLRALADGQPIDRALDSFGLSYADLEARFPN